MSIEKRKMDIALGNRPQNPDTARIMRTKISLVKKREQAYLGRNLGDQGGPIRHPRSKNLRKKSGVSNWDPWSLFHTKGRLQGS